MAALLRKLYMVREREREAVAAYGIAHIYSEVVLNNSFIQFANKIQIKAVDRYHYILVLKDQK